MVSTGYKGPKIARGLHPSGYREVTVHNVEEIAGVEPKTQAARIAHTVGMKKRALIIAEARKKKIIILNARAVKEAGKEAEEKPAPAEEKPVLEEKKKPKEKAEKPKPKAVTREKAPKAAKEPEKEKKAEKPKAPRRKKSKPEKGAEKQ